MWHCVLEMWYRYDIDVISMRYLWHACVMRLWWRCATDVMSTLHCLPTTSLSSVGWSYRYMYIYICPYIDPFGAFENPFWASDIEFRSSSAYPSRNVTRAMLRFEIHMPMKTNLRNHGTSRRLLGAFGSSRGTLLAASWGPLGRLLGASWGHLGPLGKALKNHHKR